jgi:PAS domain S-box-containing protein
VKSGLFKWLNGKSRPEPGASGKSAPDDRLLPALFDFLFGEITTPRNVRQIISKARDVLDRKNHQPEEALPLYLLLEQFLVRQDPLKKYTHTSLRTTIAKKFPALKSTPGFCVLFLPDREKSVQTGFYYLALCFGKCRQHFGNTGNGWLEKELTSLQHMVADQDAGAAFKKMQAFAKDIFHTLKENYGEVLSSKLFETAYRETTAIYGHLETFHKLTLLLPNEMINEQHLNMLNHVQMEEMLLESLSEEKRLTDALQKEIQQKNQSALRLRRNEGMMRSIFATAMDGLIIFNSKGLIGGWNKSAADIFGYAEEEVLHKISVFVLLPFQDKVKANRWMTHYLGSTGSDRPRKRFETTMVRKNGELFPVEFGLTTVETDGEVTLNAFIRDISDRKRREKELQAAREQAENAAYVKSRFLSNMSHELRTPLNGIIGTINLMLQEKYPEEQRESLNVLKYSGELMLALINDVLDFSKIEAGKLQLERSSFNLKTLLEKTRSIFQQQFAAKGVQLQLDYDEHINISVLSDEIRLNQVLHNLLSNALKFTEKGKVTLAARFISATSDSTNIRFSITDTGIGISEDKLVQIFDSFSQADVNTTRKYGGTGLGLTISRKLVELFNSELIVESRTGEGSSFYFTLCLPADTANRPYVNEQSGKDLHSLAGIRLLIAEDNNINMLVTRRFLQKWEVDFVEAQNGLQAVSLFKEGFFDLLLIDLEMPEMDGYETMKEIRKIDQEIPVIAFTAAVFEDMKSKLREHGFNDYIKKPFRPEDLHKKIVQFCKSRISS